MQNLLEELDGEYCAGTDWLLPLSIAIECWDLRYPTELNAREISFLLKILDNDWDMWLSHLELEWLSAIYKRLSDLEERHFEQLRQQQLRQQRALGEVVVRFARRQQIL